MVSKVWLMQQSAFQEQRVLGSETRATSGGKGNLHSVVAPWSDASSGPHYVVDDMQLHQEENDLGETQRFNDPHEVYCVQIEKCDE